MLTISELATRYRSGEAKPTEVAATCLQRMEALDPKVRAYLTVTRESALAQAKAAEKRLKAGKPLGLLDGVPLAIKDVICTKDVRTTCASKIL